MPDHHGAILELLIKAGFGDDPRVEHGLEWLPSMRQADGGWIVPAQAVPAKEKTDLSGLGHRSPQIDRSQPPIWRREWSCVPLLPTLFTASETR